jgi:glycerol uptake facilitator-like aquaporin
MMLDLMIKLFVTQIILTFVYMALIMGLDWDPEKSPHKYILPISIGAVFGTGLAFIWFVV